MQKLWRALRAFAVSVTVSVTGPTLAAADGLESVGDALQIAVPIYSLYLSHKQHGREGLNSCAGAVGATAVATHVMKEFIDAPRPNGSGHGFPSGHTSSAAVGFGCMLGQDGWTARTMALGAATLVTGYSRVDSLHHDWQQVGAGLALGTAIGYFSTRHLAGNVGIDYGLAPNGGQSLSFRMDF